MIVVFYMKHNAILLALLVAIVPFTTFDYVMDNQIDVEHIVQETLLPKGFNNLNLDQQQSLKDLQPRFRTGGNNENSSNLVFESVSVTTFGATGSVIINSVVLDSNDNAYFTGVFTGQSIVFGSITLQGPTGGIVSGLRCGDIFVGKMNHGGDFLWVSVASSTNVQDCSINEDDSGEGITLDKNGDVVVIGYMSGKAVTFGNITVQANCQNCRNVIVAKLNSNGDWLWAVKSDSATQNQGGSVVADSNGDYYVTGTYSGTTSFGEYSVYGNAGTFVAKLNNSGSWQWAISSTYASNGFHSRENIVIDSNDDLYVAGYTSETDLFGCSNYTGYGIFVAKLNSSGSCLWVSTAPTTMSTALEVPGITTDSIGNIFVTGGFKTTVAFGNYSLNTTQSTNDVDIFVAKMNSTGHWVWAVSARSSHHWNSEIIDFGNSIAVASNGMVYVTGQAYRGTIFGNITNEYTSGFPRIFVAQLSPAGSWNWVVNAGSDANGGTGDRGLDVAIDSFDNPFVAGSFNDFATFGSHYVPVSFASTSYLPRGFIAKLCTDSDGDQHNDCNDELPFNPTQFQDSDGDGYGDDQTSTATQADNFTDNPTQWKDSDGDGYGDNQTYGATQVDDFINEPTQWSDIDGDGYGDNPLGLAPDACPYIPGDSTEGSFLGCRDTDGDKWADNIDIFPIDETQHNDSDGDGYGDNLSGTNPDACPESAGESTRDRFGCVDSDMDGWSDFFDSFDADSSQWNDSDNDGFGDLLIGFQGDSCPEEIGNSTLDVFGCLDLDGDGWSDDGDALPENPTQWLDRDGDGFGENNSEEATEIDLFPSDGTQWNDTDGDGHGDNPYGTQGDWFPDDPTRWMDSDRDATADEDDAFPNDATQQVDSDGDGYGDNIDGNRGDSFPNDPLEWKDSDDDGLGDNTDMFPYDPTQTEDRDGDGMGDNPMGIGADKFPDDPTQWGDIDGDGHGDNQTGTNPDKFITDATQWADRDGDGYGDNPQGRLYDMFPDNPTQWKDVDEDGLGDNQSGTNADPSLNDFDNDGYNDSIDPLPKLSSPGDLDNDGVFDINDIFPEDAREWSDYDGDGEGDNADTDDDNDGWADTEEVRLGTDPFGAGDVPVDSFEIVIPGTAVGLGAWDLIGMFGGIPLAFWIGFGFATRNGRTAKYEALLREAQTRDELEGVARMWEYSLMLRMLGPHQGIRLERLRAELDDKFEAMNQTLSSVENNEFDQTQMVIQEMNDTEKQIPELVSHSDYPSIEDIAQKTDENGYEWFTAQDGTNFYRTIGSQTEWMELEVDSEP